MSTQKLSDYKICILSTNGFEQSELFEPYEQLKEAGATVHIVSPETGEIKGWDQNDWGKSISVDRALADVTANDYDALILPGGQINPDILRLNADAIALVRAFNNQDKPIAAICHAPWLMIEAGLAMGRTMTGYASIRTDLRNAGASVRDEAVDIDSNLITSRQPEDLNDFIAAIGDLLTGSNEALAA